jgi:hypothetical protein
LSLLEFDYTVIEEDGRFRPYFDVKIRLAEGGVEREFTGLLDSGADDTVFPVSAARAIGLSDLSRCPVVTYSTAGDPVQVYRYTLQVCVLGRWHTWEIGLNEHLGQTPLLGRTDFFRLFKEVRFDDAREKFFLLTDD